MSKYKVEEFRQTLLRAFKGKEDMFIFMDGDSCRNEYLRESWSYYLTNKYIRVETVNLEQETFMKGYITQEGKDWVNVQ